MVERKAWTRDQLLIAFKLYCEIPFGKMHKGNSLIISYANLIQRTPSALAMKLTNIASLDPVIVSSGRKGLPGASKADQKMWDEMQSDWELFSVEMNRVSEELIGKKKLEDQEVETIPNDDYSSESKRVESNVRVGQEFFRRSVLSAYDNKCCISGLNVPELLIASHIIPWKDNKNNRLNPRNGLCLSMIHDKAFDKGIITIRNDFTVRVSDRYLKSENDFFRKSLLAFNNKLIDLPQKFQPEADFLKYHQESIFIS